ncbi:tetratricopeptide repeat-containing sensor histidine kinase [Chryseobacterium caseinilyticum]|uniref:Tetratricopeptide repeat protein n=1 Tax=Chryseobacterium caseinilyticum TaxID=2771428 RepID=A0ABR8Z9Y5_9FLAO|nr:tetratricopeptide repeat protein [Chryseobacterium caseinilyticum]MBD8082119.1 tetratricopeptide repeat protein [Chryseobacterium caseinilyticum]
MNKLILAFLLLTLLNCSKKSNTVKNFGKDNESYAKARICRDAGVLDSAFIYYNAAKSKYKETKDSLGIAQSLINMAHIQTNSGDYYGGIESSLEADSFLKNIKNQKIRQNLPGNYNNIAMASAFLGNFEDAVKYYEKALPYTSKQDLPVIFNNIGDAYSELGDYQKAMNMFRRSLEGSDSENMARVINNLAIAEYKFDPTYNPVPAYHKAMKIRLGLNDQHALNSSYSAISNYYTGKNKDSALFYSKKMLSAATLINNPDDQLKALRKIINIDEDNSSLYFKKFISINDSVNNARFKAKNQFALIKTNMAESEAKNAELALQNSENKNEKRYAQIGVLALVITLIAGIFYYFKRKKLQQQEKEIEVKKTEIKYSKKVHDVVANGIYQIMTKIENHQDISRNETLDDLEDVYKKSRNISYDSSDDINDDNFFEKISKLVSYFKNENTETYLAGNDAELWKNTAPSTRSEIYQILREMLVNMKKHSRADRVILQFKKVENNIEISYSDNGIGIQNKSFFKKGLQNVVSRIENLNGDIIFDTETEKGLKINLSFPIS